MDNEVKNLVSQLEAPISDVVERLRGLLAEVIPDAIEEPDLSAKLIGYSYQPGTYKGLIAAIAPHTEHVNLMLSRGADLLEADASGLLEGTGKKARHIKFRTIADVSRPGVRTLIEKAARHTPRP